MIKPRNGSALSNCLLVTAGAVAGACVTAWLHAPADPATLSAKSLIPAGTQTLPARQPALGARAGGTGLPSGSALSPQAKSKDLTDRGYQSGLKNPADAMQEILTIPGDADRLDFLRGAMEAWALTDPQAALEYARTQLPAGQMQSEAIRLALEAWSGKEPRAAFSWIEQNLSGPGKEEAMGTFAQSWARTSPEKAAAWFMETGSTSQTLLNSLVSGWAAVDPAAAIAWSGKLPDPGNRNVSLTTAVGELARQDPAAAAAAAAPFLTDAPVPPTPAGAAPPPAKPAVPDLPTILADIWGSSDPASAAQWISELPAGASRTEAATTLATVWAAHDIQAAVTWSEGFADPTLRASIVEHLGTTWGAIEPDKALAWLATQPPDIAANGIQGAYNSWAATDPAGMRDWISQLQPGLGSDQARRALGDVVSANDPLAAIDLARSLYSPSAQSDALNRYYHAWQRQSPAEARDWLTQEWATLPPQARQKMAQ